MPKYKVLGFIEHENKAYSPSDFVEMTEAVANLHAPNLVREQNDSLTDSNPDLIREQNDSLTDNNPDLIREKENSLSKKKNVPRTP